MIGKQKGTISHRMLVVYYCVAYQIRDLTKSEMFSFILLEPHFGLELRFGYDAKTFARNFDN